MNFEKNTLSTNANKQLAYTHIKQGSDRICFMFCGAGYTYDKPLLYYATKVMLGKGMDVVHVHYSYREAEFDLPFNEFADLMVKEVELVVEKVEGDYREVIFLGKSIGTIPIISHYLKSDRHSNTKFILLTPLLRKDVFFEQLDHVGTALPSALPPSAPVPSAGKWEVPCTPSFWRRASCTSWWALHWQSLPCISPGPIPRSWRISFPQRK